MNKSLRVPDYLGHILDAIAKISEYLDGMDWPAFSANSRTQDAVVRNLEIIGEAGRKIGSADPGFMERHPDFPLARAIGMRNALAHGYLDVKLDVVWKTAKSDLPALALQVAELLTRLGEQGKQGEQP